MVNNNTSLRVVVRDNTAHARVGVLWPPFGWMASHAVMRHSRLPGCWRWLICNSVTHHQQQHQHHVIISSSTHHRSSAAAAAASQSKRHSAAGAPPLRMLLLSNFKKLQRTDLSTGWRGANIRHTSHIPSKYKYKKLPL